MQHLNGVPVSGKDRDRLKIVRTWMVNSVRIITVLWLIVHFILTTIYAYLIANPVQNELQPLLDATIARFFPQDWELFAPLPFFKDAELLVRPLTNDEYQASLEKGLLPSDRWYDITSPLWPKLQSNRFSSYWKLARSLALPIYRYVNTPPDQRADYSADQLQILITAASAFCKDTGQDNAIYVALTVRELFSKPWSQRDTSNPRVVKTTFIGIYPVDNSVESPHIYQIGEQ